MAIDLDALIAPISTEGPAGPDLTYEAARQEIEEAFERSVSDDNAAPSDTDWRDVIRKIVAQAAVTRDICLPIYLMRAGASAGDLEAVEDGAQLLAGLFEQLWATVHPQLDDYGFQGRKGPCESLTRIGEFLNPLRNVVLLQHPRLGSYTGADFDRFRSNGDNEDGYGMFRALLAETQDDTLNEIIARITGIADAIRRADGVLVVNAGDDTGTNFQPTYGAFAEIAKGVASFLRTPSALVDDDDAGSDSSGGDEDDSGRSGDSIGGRVNSRQDVLRSLDAIADYYVRKEPASPVPFALRRAREWVSLDFLAVLEDIAPGSLEEARRVLVSGRNNNKNEPDNWSSE